MPTCLPSYSSNSLPPGPSCDAACAGVSYQVVSVRQGKAADGSCTFTYKVQRLPDGKVFSGTEVLSCASNRTITFYCDKTEACPIFELSLQCVQDLSPID